MPLAMALSMNFPADMRLRAAMGHDLETDLGSIAVGCLRSSDSEASCLQMEHICVAWWRFDTAGSPAGAALGNTHTELLELSVAQEARPPPVHGDAGAPGWSMRSR